MSDQKVGRIARLMSAWRVWRMRRVMRELDEMRGYMQATAGRDIESGNVPSTVKRATDA